MLLPLKSNGQYLGYTFSYTLPYTNTQDRPDVAFFGGYEKKSQYSIGISFNNYVSQVKSLQVRLSHYNSRLVIDRTSFFGGSYEESKVGQYLMELEGYFLSKEYSSGIGVSLGAKYSLLLRSSHQSINVTGGVETLQKTVNFNGLRKSKFEFLARLNIPKINLSEDLTFMPSYVFGYGFSNDFNITFINSSSINHRFEITLFKSLSTKEE